MSYRWVDFFTDPLLRAPTIGSMLMCIAASLIGTLVFLRKKSLVGETLSHAAYPGLMVGALISAVLPVEGFSIYLLLGCAFLSSTVALFLLEMLLRRFRVTNDAALCFILSSFFGIGILLASRLQTSHPVWYRQVQTFLYGQAATMSDAYIGIYAALLLFVITFIVCLYPRLRLVYFDPTFAATVGISTWWFEKMFSLLLVLAVIVAMKSVGVVLLSGMLIAPAVTARRYTRHLSSMLILGGVIGGVCGFLGSYSSVQLSLWMIKSRLVFPTGPMIVLISSFFCLITLIFSHSKRKKIAKICYAEEMLKVVSRIGEGKNICFIARQSQKGFFITWGSIFLAKKRGWIIRKKGGYHLSDLGRKQLYFAEQAEKKWALEFLQGRSKRYLSAEEIIS